MSDEMRPPPLPSIPGDDTAFRTWVVGELVSQRAMLRNIEARMGAYDLKRNGAITALIVALAEGARMLLSG